MLQPRPALQTGKEMKEGARVEQNLKGETAVAFFKIGLILAPKETNPHLGLYAFNSLPIGTIRFF